VSLTVSVPGPQNASARLLIPFMRGRQCVAWFADVGCQGRVSCFHLSRMLQLAVRLHPMRTASICVLQSSQLFRGGSCCFFSCCRCFRFVGTHVSVGWRSASRLRFSSLVLACYVMLSFLLDERFLGTIVGSRCQCVHSPRGEPLHLSGSRLIASLFGASVSPDSQHALCVDTFLLELNVDPNQET
jgi:hypothetical protein